ncbi:hypothetical protein AGABI1DRAFT_108652 [Agaricus bisporus var. burnettii JB137-S8]|uniref:HNH nuclease domain-containing protein n=1 Tax=Agaricus bisporus var. burnettii (strain JB137-S8 / ATCC MYA-4627 / FGSC 10392) TaxID=597362 RepID=K5X0Z1_AGABU|nr:uncharacterized protein AGABI1DRAFT_108652 [Agaricus bisporus var. burnettii JB137-S8]EKM76557.1 hypothetical protein AGABI1DRAFT_108652 [Agaricus bisporus var. burnettii JB137-S8]
MDSKNARNKDLMASLEWNWNMPYGALNLNTRYNIFFAGAALHLHYDNDSWGLLPERSIIDHYYERLDEERTKFPKEELLGDGFEYRLIPLGDSMKLYCILRQNEHAPPPNKDQYTFHFYPFDTLPPFRSHLHPKFAIVELGRKYHELRGKNLAAASAALSSYPILSRVNRIYAAWLLLPKGTPLFEEWKNKGSTDGNKDPQPESSSGTGYDSWRNLGRQIEDEDQIVNRSQVRTQGLTLGDSVLNAGGQEMSLNKGVPPLQERAQKTSQWQIRLAKLCLIGV